MQLLMKNPVALAARTGLPVTDLAGASIDPEISQPRRPTQAEAWQLARAVFGNCVVLPFPAIGHQRDRTTRTADIEKVLTANFNYSPELARWIIREIRRDEEMRRVVVTVAGKRYARRDSGINLKKGPLSKRLGGEYVYGQPPKGGAA